MKLFLLKNASIIKRYQVILAITLAFIVYFPVSFGEFCSVDDVTMVSSLGSLESWKMKDVFIPATAEGLYYRPVLMLSFFIDKNAFALDPGIMHIENIILHGINSLLIFWLTYQLLPVERRRNSYLPLVSALVFGLHPITTESVSWVSGRTDVLACAFILASVNFLLLFKRHHFYRYFVCSVVFMFFGFLTKETALLFLPGFFLLISAKDNGTENGAQGRDTFGHFRMRALVYLSSLGAVFLFFILRSASFMSNEGRIRYTMQVIMLDPFYSAMVVIETFAFYIKKIFFPLPLNFAIIEVDPLYEFIALPLVIVCLFILFKRTVRSALFMAGIFLIAPAFLPAFGQLAWTAYAERYVYIPTAFIMTATVMYLGELVQRKQILLERVAPVVTVVLIVAAFIITFQRSLVWMSNLSLFQDTVAKNPTFYVVRAEYARALALSGDFQNALTQFKQAKREDQQKVVSGSYVKSPFYSGRFGYWPNPDLGIAYILVQEGKIEEAVILYETIYSYLPDRGEQTGRVLGWIVSLYGDLLGKVRTPADELKIKKKLSFYTKKLYSMKRNPEAFFHLGKISLLRGEKKEALDYFGKAYDLFPEDDAYKAIAEKHIKSLKI